MESFKDDAYAALSEVTRAMSSPRRLELLDLLIQGPRSVEALARGTRQPLASASQHLQVLKRSRLVLTERHGTTVEYRLAPGVAAVFVALRRLAEARSAELGRVTEAFFAGAEAPSTIGVPELMRRLDDGDATLIDVRPRAEFDHGHLPGARSFPLAELEARLHELPADALVVATCRGPFCAFAADAVRLLRRHGRAAVRFEHGVAEWEAEVGPVVRGPEA